MASDYRDELSAAHSRIAELEDKVAALETEAKRAVESTSVAGRFPELEAAVERHRQAADPVREAKRRSMIILVASMIPIAGAIFSFRHEPLVATACSVVYTAIIVFTFVLRARVKSSKRLLDEAEQRLADARRVRELEERLAAATTKVRVDGAGAATSADDASEDASAEAEARAAGRGA